MLLCVKNRQLTALRMAASTTSPRTNGNAPDSPNELTAHGAAVADRRGLGRRTSDGADRLMAAVAPDGG